MGVLVHRMVVEMGVVMNEWKDTNFVLVNCKCKLEQHHKAPLNSNCSQIATSLKWNGICRKKQKPYSLLKQLLTK